MGASGTMRAGAAAVAALAFATAGCGTGGGGDGGGSGPGPATPELVSLTSEGGSESGADRSGGITVSGAAAFADGSYVTVGTCTAGATFGLGTPAERSVDAGLLPCLYVARHRGDGTLAWVRLCSQDSAGGSFPPEAPSDVVAMPDGSVVFTGRLLDGLRFEPAGTDSAVVLDQGTQGAFTAAYDADGKLLFAHESIAAVWDARLAAVNDGRLYAMLATVRDAAVIVPAAANPMTIAAPERSQTLVARFDAATGRLHDWTLLDTGVYPRVLVAIRRERVAGLAPVACGLPGGGLAVAGLYGGPGFVGLAAPADDSDAFVLRLDDDLKVTWARALSGPSAETVHALAAAPGGGVVVTGSYSETCDVSGATRTLSLASPPGAPAQFLCAHDAAGEPLWARNAAALASDLVEAHLAIGADGSIGVAQTCEAGLVLDPAGDATAVPAPQLGASDALFTRWSATGTLLDVGRLCGDAQLLGAALLSHPDGSWRLLTHGTARSVYDPAGPQETTAPCRGTESTFTLHLRTR